MMPVDGSTGRVDGGGGASDGGGGDDGSVMCMGTHPLLDGARRYCETGDCFCADPDACHPEAVAAACCSVAVVCGDTDAGAPADAGPMCMGTHPLVEGMRRYCEPGACFCSNPDACFPAATASGCCNVAVVCE